MALKTPLLAFALTDVTITGGKKPTNQPTNQGARTKGCNPYGRAPLVAGTNIQTSKQTTWRTVLFTKLITSLSPSQEIPCSLLNPKVHYRIRMRPPLVSILSQTNLAHGPVIFFEDPI
jgi:hypothetical protein